MISSEILFNVRLILNAFIVSFSVSFYSFCKENINFTVCKNIIYTKNRYIFLARKLNLKVWAGLSLWAVALTTPLYYPLLWNVLRLDLTDLTILQYLGTVKNRSENSFCFNLFAAEGWSNRFCSVWQKIKELGQDENVTSKKKNPIWWPLHY